MGAQSGSGEGRDDVIDLDAERDARRPPEEDDQERTARVVDPPSSTDDALRRLASALDIPLDGRLPPSSGDGER